MKIAFCALKLHLPPRFGMDIHTTQIGRALAGRGHDVRFFTQQQEGMHLLGLPHETLDLEPHLGEQTESGGSWLGKRLSRYRGATPARQEAFRRTIGEGGFDACVYSGVDGLAWLDRVDSCARVWYAADDSVLASLSQIRLKSRASSPVGLLREALLNAIYERVFRNHAESIWVVSEQDRRWMSRTMGGGLIETIPNGVDLDYYTCTKADPRPHRIAFWGNLDFGPNQAAIEWFLPAVWDRLHSEVSDAEFYIIGRRPPAWIRRVTERPGVKLLADVPDLRPDVCSAPVAVFPFRSGFGIKNKFLEGASMGRALLASPPVLAGLYPAAEEAWLTCDTPADWISALKELWRTPERGRRMGGAARNWIEQNYTWDRAALQAEKSIANAIRLTAGRRRT